MPIFFAIIIFVMMFVGWGGTRFVNLVQFDQNVGGYLKRAADANTIELAKENLSVALKSIKESGMTQGYTSLLWRTPDEDVGFWFQNLSASLKELESARPEATQLEKSNLLIKLRETLLDSGKQGGVEVTAPDGISIYPRNTLYALWGWLSIILTFFMGMLAVFKD